MAARAQGPSRAGQTPSRRRHLPQEERGRQAARKQAAGGAQGTAQGRPSVSGQPAGRSGNGVPAAIRRPPGLPPRPQITEAADPPCWKAKPHSGLDKKTILRSGLRDSDAGRDPLSPKAPVPTIPVEKDLHLGRPGKFGRPRSRRGSPISPCPSESEAVSGSLPEAGSACPSRGATAPLQRRSYPLCTRQACGPSGSP